MPQEAFDESFYAILQLNEIDRVDDPCATFLPLIIWTVSKVFSP